MSNTDSLVEAITEETTPVKSFVVVEVYYKHGEHDVYECESEEILRDVLMDHILDNRFGLPVTSYTYKGIDLETMELGELIELAKERGRKYMREQSGHGIVAVIEGSLL